VRYRVEVRPKAEKELKALPRRTTDKVRAIIRGLAEDPRPRGVKKLASGDGYRVRIGDIRMVHDVNDPDRLVDIKSVLHRKDAYR
jgi:mRNA interferase RelE/StbE